MTGQTTDFLASKKTIESFNMDLYKNIAVHKTAHYTYTSPTFLGMALANVTDVRLFERVESILKEIGYYFQVKDDYLDCFSDQTTIGKVGNDIKEGKCSWLAVKFMEIASPEQKSKFAKYYGTEQDDLIKDLYEEVGLREYFRSFEEDSYRMIRESISMMPQDVPLKFFYNLIDSLYNQKV